MKKHKLNLYPEITGEQFENLKEKLSSGYDKTFPVVLFEGAILDGWNRFRACQELKIHPVVKEFTGTQAEALEFIFRSNERRDLTPSQRAAIALEYLPLLEVEAEKRMKAGYNQYKKSPTANLPQGESRVIAAEKIGAGQRYVSDVKKIKAEQPEYFQKILSGELNVNEVKKEIKRQEVEKRNQDIKNNVVSAPKGKYDVIVIDPPWPMQKIDRDCSPEQVGFDYPTMTIDEIKDIELPMADNCHLFIWTTQKFLPITFDIINHWGLKYVFTMTWHKNGGFQPFNLPQYNSEFCLYARQGTPGFMTTKNFFTCFNADRTKHSEKPEEFYDIVRRVTGGKKIDMFNRRKIEGFASWGNEAWE